MYPPFSSYLIASSPAPSLWYWRSRDCWVPAKPTRRSSAALTLALRMTSTMRMRSTMRGEEDERQEAEKEEGDDEQEYDERRGGRKAGGREGGGR
jgi:hypothetical protein